MSTNRLVAAALGAVLCGVALTTAAAESPQGTTNTANVDVTVLPAATAGQPVPTREGFAVCIGTPADRDQFGRQSTPANGVANEAFRNLPTGTSVLITVQKAGFRGWEQTRTLAAGWNNHVQAQVQPGTGGPSCGATTATPPASAPLQTTATATINVAQPPASSGINPTGRDDSIKIMAMNINNGATSVMLDDQVRLFFRLAGPLPTEMRVSETSGQFPEPWAAWTTFAPHPGGPLAQGMNYVFHQAPSRKIQSEASRKTLYLQFRREGRVSNIGTASIDVRKIHVIGGGEAFEEATRQGFVFLTKGFNLANFVDKCRMQKAPVGGSLEFAAPGGLSLTGHCQFDIFTGRVLKTPWTLEAFKFDSSQAVTCSPAVFPPTNGPSSLAASVRVPFVNTGGGCIHRLTTIALRGPAGTSWQSAFAK